MWSAHRQRNNRSVESPYVHVALGPVCSGKPQTAGPDWSLHGSGSTNLPRNFRQVPEVMGRAKTDCQASKRVETSSEAFECERLRFLHVYTGLDILSANIPACIPELFAARTSPRFVEHRLAFLPYSRAVFRRNIDAVFEIEFLLRGDGVWHAHQHRYHRSSLQKGEHGNVGRGNKTCSWRYGSSLKRSVEVWTGFQIMSGAANMNRNSHTKPKSMKILQAQKVP